MDLIRVRTEVVRAVMVEQVAAEAERRAALPLPAEVEEVLGAAAALAPDAPGDAARAAARLGFVVRAIERERYAPARAPVDWLADASAEACLELARDEPPEKPRPDDPAAVTWRVPGPGGHVRHELAVLAGDGLKRPWVFGFLLACR